MATRIVPKTHLRDRIRESLLLSRATTRLDWFIAAVIALLLPLGVMLAPQAEAYTYNGCKYPGSDPAIRYRFYSVGSTWQESHSVGANRWNSYDVPGVFIKTTSTDPEIRVYDGNYSWSHRAITSGGCDSGGGQPWYNNLTEIRYNTRTTSGLTYTERRLVATHELGHSYGLGHSTLGCSNPVVMRSDATWAYHNCGTSAAPYANDRLGVQNLYG